MIAAFRSVAVKSVFGSRFKSFLAVLLAGIVWCSPAIAQQRLELLASIKPWPVATNPIIYEGRLWFSASVLGSNHNSADIWSLDPQSSDLAGGLRYENHLFSQDAGSPVIFQGLLYWPHEDPRLSLGYGAISVTDGRQWTQLEIRTATIFHVHHLVDWGGTLVAATSAWRAGLQSSDDGGASWSEFYNHPTPPRRVSRLLHPAVNFGRFYFMLRDPEGSRLARITRDQPAVVESWPKKPFRALTADGDVHLYGIVGNRGVDGIWKSNGRKSQQLSNPPGSGYPVDLFVGQDRLWALFNTGSGGYVASYSKDDKWRIEAEFDGGTPHELVVTANQILVTGTGADGKAAIWGIKDTALPKPSAGYRREFPVPFKLPANENIDWQRQSDRLKEALLDPSNFKNHGRDGLREVVRSIAALSPPADFLAKHLDAPMAKTRVHVIGKEAEIPAKRMGKWILLWGMRSNSQSRVPVELLGEPWQTEPRKSQKYFAPLLAALFTIAHNRQSDAETIDALIDRLRAQKDPPWLQGDIIGTLSAITGKKFGYDVDRWQQWRNQARSQ